MRKIIIAGVISVFVLAMAMFTPAHTADITNPGPCAVFGSVTGTCLQGGGPLGTPSSGVATNLTGTAAGLTAGAATSATSATNATNAANITIVDDTSTGAVMYPTWVTANTGNLPVKTSSTKLSFIPSTGALSAVSYTSSGATAGYLLFDRTSDATNTWLTYATGGTTLRIYNANDATDWVTIAKGTGAVNFIGQVFTPNATSDAGLADSTACIRTSNGQILKGSGTLGICLGTSGAQFKTAFAPMVAGIDEIAKIKLWNYRYLNGFGDSGERIQYGATAQDVEKVLPDLVRYDSKGEVINYDIGAFVPIALHALQQLKADNDNLRECNKNWKCRIFGQ